MEHLPNYDLWRLQSPPEPPNRCICGHDYEEHLGENELAKAGIDLLKDLKAIKKRLERGGNAMEALDEIERIVDNALIVCQADGCTCQKLEEEE